MINIIAAPNHYSSVEEYLLKRIAELEYEVLEYKELLSKQDQIISCNTPIINPITNEVVGYKTYETISNIGE